MATAGHLRARQLPEEVEDVMDQLQTPAPAPSPSPTRRRTTNSPPNRPPDSSTHKARRTDALPYRCRACSLNCPDAPRLAGAHTHDSPRGRPSLPYRAGAHIRDSPHAKPAAAHTMPLHR